MKKISKLVKTITTVGILAAPTFMVLACSPKETLDENKYQAYSGPKTIAKEHVYFVTDGGKTDDKSFNQSGFEGFKDATQHSEKSSNVLAPENANLIKDEYNSALAKKAKLIIGMGFLHTKAMKAVAIRNPGVGFIYVDGEIKVDSGSKKRQQGNILSIIFKVEQAAFLQGIVAAHKANEIDPIDPMVGFWGGADIPPVTSFIKGLQAGIDYFNKHKPIGKKDVKYPATKSKINLNAGFAPNGGTATATQLLTKGADLLLPVAGPQVEDAIKAIKSSTSPKARVIGVDTDWKEQVDTADKKYIFDSIKKELRQAVKKAVEKLMLDTGDANYGFGNIITEDLDSNGVSINSNILDANLVDSSGNKLTKETILAAAKQAPSKLE